MSIKVVGFDKYIELKSVFKHKRLELEYHEVINLKRELEEIINNNKWNRNHVYYRDYGCTENILLSYDEAIDLRNKLNEVINKKLDNKIYINCVHYRPDEDHCAKNFYQSNCRGCIFFKKKRR